MIGKAAIEHIAARTGIPLQTLQGIAGFLRKADDDYWPRGVQGGRRPVHVEARHLAYLWCALARNSVRNAVRDAQDLGDARSITPLTQSEPVITEDRGLGITKADIDAAAWSFLVSWFDVLQRGTLLDGITWLIEAMADDRNPAIDLFRKQDLALIVVIQPNPTGPSCHIDFTYTTDKLPIVRGRICSLVGVNSTTPPDGDWLRHLGMGWVETRACRDGQFMALAECWADTKAQLADIESPPGSDPAGEESPSFGDEGDSEAPEKSEVKKLHPYPYGTTLVRRPDRRAKGGVRATANSAWTAHARHERSHDAHRLEPA